MTENSKKLVEIIWKYLKPSDLSDEEKSFIKDVEKRADSDQLGKVVNNLVYIIESYTDIKHLNSKDYETFSDAREIGIIKDIETNHIIRLSVIIANQEEDIRKKRESNKRLEDRGTIDMIELGKRQERIDELEKAFDLLPDECEHYDHCSETAIENHEPDRDESRD